MTALRTGEWWGTQTTEAKARQAAQNPKTAGCHLIKWYDGKFVGCWRYKTPEAAQQSMADDLAFGAKFKQGYLDANLPVPARPWTYEVI